MNRLSLAFFAAALLIVSVVVLAFAVRTGAVSPAWTPAPASAESIPASDGPGSSAQL
jgi:hypothetical protein